MVWHVFPFPSRRPPCRGNPLGLALHVFEAQVLPMLNSTFRMESHLRVFGLTNQLNIVFKRPRGRRERPPGNSSSCSPIRGRRWSQVSNPNHVMLGPRLCTKCGREVGGWFNPPAWQCRDAEGSTASSARSGRSGGGSRNQHAPNAESSWRRSHTCRASKTGIGSEGRVLIACHAC